MRNNILKPYSLVQPRSNSMLTVDWSPCHQFFACVSLCRLFVCVSPLSSVCHLVTYRSPMCHLRVIAHFSVLPVCHHVTTSPMCHLSSLHVTMSPCRSCVTCVSPRSPVCHRVAHVSPACRRVASRRRAAWCKRRASRRRRRRRS